MHNSTILPINAFKDNYIWLFYNKKTRNAWVVDPGDAAPVIKILNELQLQLKGILITHHHHDHTGGIDKLLQHWNNASVIGSQKSPIESITHRVKEADEVDCFPFKLTILEIPGHTLDHIAYYNSEILFCGDTLFSFGCGKIFEGTPEQMFRSLHKLLKLPDTIQIYCGHEYTLSNLRFAQHVEPHNLILIDQIEKIKILREKNMPSLPSSLLIEKQLNPFLRCDQKSIKHAVESYCNKRLLNPVEVFTELRAWKNSI